MPDMTHPYQPSAPLRYWRVRRRDAPDYWIVFQHDPVDAKADPEREVEELFTATQLAAEVERAVAEERERCAKLCDRLTEAIDNGGNAYRREAGAGRCAAAIRSSAPRAGG